MPQSARPMPPPKDSLESTSESQVKLCPRCLASCVNSRITCVRTVSGPTNIYGFSLRLISVVATSGGLQTCGTIGVATVGPLELAGCGGCFHLTEPPLLSGHATARRRERRQRWSGDEQSQTLTEPFSSDARVAAMRSGTTSRLGSAILGVASPTWSTANRPYPLLRQCRRRSPRRWLKALGGGDQRTTLEIRRLTTNPTCMTFRID